MESPRPEPPSLVEKKGVKRFFMCSGGIPQPSSLIVISRVPGLHGVQEEVQEDLLDLAGVHSEGEVGILIGLVDGNVLFEEVIA